MGQKSARFYIIRDEPIREGAGGFRERAGGFREGAGEFQREISRSEKGPADSEKGSADFEIGSKISPFLYILGLGQKSTGFANLGFGQTSAGFTKFGVRSNWGPGCMNFEVWSTLGPQVCEHWGAEGTPRSPLPRLYFSPNLAPFFSKTGHQKPAHIPAPFLRPKVYFP